MLTSRIVVSASAAEARRSAAEWLVPVLGKSEAIVVGATRASADEFARSLPGAGAFGVHRFTILQLAAVIGARGMTEAGLAPVSRLASEAIAARVSDRLRRLKQLPYFGRVARMPGFAGALAATLSDLRLCGVQTAADDIGRLLRAYDKELKDRALGDLAILLDTAARVGEHPLLGLPVVFLDAPLESHRHEIFASRLVKGAPAVLAVVHDGDERTLDAYKRLIRRAPDRAAEQNTNALARLRAHVFSNERPPSGEMDASVELFAAPGEGLEAVEIARRIQKLATDGLPFDEVAILLRGPERYQPFLEEALRRGGIPAYFSRGVARPDPAGRAFLALLACASERCSATRFAEYLSLGEIPALDADGAPVEQPPSYVPPDDELLNAFTAAPVGEAEPVGETRATVATPIAWERMLVDAAVVGGRERWARRLRGLEREMELRLASLGTEDEPRRLHLTEELVKLRALERFALPLIDLLGALPREASWGEWLEQLDRLARSALQHPTTVIAVLNELEPMADIGPVELDEVTGVLNDRLRFLRREPARRRYGRVFVGSVEEARGRVFQAVFLPGLAEGLFPGKQFEDPLLLDDARRRIALELRTRDDARADERQLLRTAANSATSRLIVSYPSMDLAQGKARVPSFYALEVARAIEGRVPALRAFETGTRKRANVKLAWPAPNAPADAIDETEFDLAWFEGHRGMEGGAAYLKRHTHLARSLRARYMRWERKWQTADGLINIDTPGREILCGHRLDKRSYSASSLQQFAACPYRFYLHAVAQLRQKEDKAGIEQMDPLTRGALFHETQFQFFQSVMRKQPESLDATLGALDAALEDVEAKYREDLAPAIERVWQTEIEDMRNDLRGWARHWWADRAEWRTLHAELAFGLAGATGRDPHSQAEEVIILNGMRVRGAIDLIEKSRHRNALRITDHKTGKAPPQEPAFVGGGLVLQPALYGLAAESMLGTPVEGGRLFFCTQRGGFTPVDIQLGEPARRFLAEALRTIDSAIETGFLPPAPSPGACDFCDYRIVCGPYEETRAKRKPKESLESLNYIRSMP